MGTPCKPQKKRKVLLEDVTARIVDFITFMRQWWEKCGEDAEVRIPHCEKYSITSRAAAGIWYILTLQPSKVYFSTFPVPTDYKQNHCTENVHQ